MSQFFDPNVLGSHCLSCSGRSYSTTTPNNVAFVSVAQTLRLTSYPLSVKSAVRTLAAKSCSLAPAPSLPLFDHSSSLILPSKDKECMKRVEALKTLGQGATLTQRDTVTQRETLA
ncbi:hypothetical protein HKD37_01G002052 [Glycine soja]